MFYVEQSRGKQKRALRPFEAVEKVAKRHFFEFFHPVLAPMARSAPNAKYENLWVFIRSDAHPPGGLLLPLRGNSPCVVRAGLNIRGCGPLSTLGFFDTLKGPCGPLCRIYARVSGCVKSTSSAISMAVSRHSPGTYRSAPIMAPPQYIPPGPFSFIK